MKRNTRNAYKLAFITGHTHAALPALREEAYQLATDIGVINQAMPAAQEHERVLFVMFRFAKRQKLAAMVKAAAHKGEVLV